jgi:hypothetical protein
MFDDDGDDDDKADEENEEGEEAVNADDAAKAVEGEEVAAVDDVGNDVDVDEDGPTAWSRQLSSAGSSALRLNTRRPSAQSAARLPNA